MTSPRPGYSSHFGADNVPFGIASSATHTKPTCVSRFEDNVIFLSVLQDTFSGISDLPHGIFEQNSLNAFAALPQTTRQAVRSSLQEMMKGNKLSTLPSNAVEHIASVTMHLPVEVGDFTV